MRAPPRGIRPAVIRPRPPRLLLNDLIVVVAPCTLTGGTISVTDNNADGLGTYVQVDSDRTGFSTAGVLTVWVRNALIGSATSTVFTATQTGSTGGGLDVFRVSGMSYAGAAAVRQTAGQSTGTAGTTPAPVLGAAALTGNPLIGAVCNGTSPATMTPRTSWTEATDLGYATPTTGMETMYRSSGETGTTQTWGSTSATAFASVVIELTAAAPETSPSLEVYGFSIPSPPLSTATINSVTVAITEHQSSAIQAPCTFELWDYSSTPAIVGTTQTGTPGTSTGNVSSATFTGVTYAMLATLRVRVYGHAPAGSSYIESVDGVSLVVNYTPSPNATVVMGSALAVTTTKPAPLVNQLVASPLAVTVSFPAPTVTVPAITQIEDESASYVLDEGGATVYDESYVSGSVTVTPATLTASTGTPAPAVSGSALVSPGVLAVTSTKPARWYGRTQRRHLPPWPSPGPPPFLVSAAVSLLLS